MAQLDPDASPPSLGLSQESAGEWTVVHVRGDIDAATVEQLRECLITTTATGVRHLLLDLSAVGFMDSTALSALVGAHKRLRTLDGQLRLVMSSKINLRLLTITHLDRVFEVLPQP